ncbi:MAG: KH domain-containing protein [Dehalococcoidia bacterium]|nr:KH domain-containing protein [Dehalococcoidia bacterium]MDZ4246996.1 KH domain-containing protein [Dehalococcoidia bacterium]
MKELIEYIAKSIVNEPDQVVVSEEDTDNGKILKLQVAPDDKGRVIGRQGRVAQAMRTLLHVMVARSDTKEKVELEIV